MPEEKIKISPVKGRPMLRWVGKQPLDYVKGFPARLVEVFDPLNTGQKMETPTYNDLKDNWQNLLFHGDNKEVMATLIENGFRGKIDLIYIAPPFKSGADYVRKVELRGMRKLGILTTDDASLLQQVMYEDIWNNDSYLQFMYERLMLMKELLSEKGSIYIHLDWHVGHYVKLIMDEIFGRESFRNEIVWEHQGSWIEPTNNFPRRHQMILLYTKSKEFTFRRLYEADTEEQINYQRWKEYIVDNKIYGKNAPLHDARFKTYYEKFIKEYGQKPNEDDVIVEFKGSVMGNVWYVKVADPKSPENLRFQTQKPEALLKRIILSSTRDQKQTNENGEGIPIVLDCFLGSGTTTAAAQSLGRRWIGCDINKGAIQMTSKRLQKIILNQGRKTKEEELPQYCSFGIYQVNNYDLQLLKTEATGLAIQHIGIQRVRTDIFFDGTLGKSLVKIIDFNHPLTLLDLQLIKDELNKRPQEDRDIVIVCLGKELAVDPEIERWNVKQPYKDARTKIRMKQIKVIELKTDKRYGHFLIHDPAEAKIVVERTSEDKAVIEIQDFISPTIIKRLNIESGLFRVKIPDFRCMIDTVLIDNNYDGKTFRIVYSDVPEKKDDLVQGKHEIALPNPEAKVAVKIIDMLGEEVLIEHSLSQATPT